MLTILHASDLHFGRPYLPEVGEALLAAAEDAAPDVIVLSGDFTQRAKVREYREAKAFMARLPDVPTIVTPGNHDIPVYRVFERLFSPFRNYREYLSPELDSVVRVEGAVFVSLCSATPYRAIVNGWIRREQIEFAARAFERSSETDVRVIVAHHHFAPTHDYEGDRQIPRVREILDALSRMGVELVFGGHVHRAYVGNSLDVSPGHDRGIVIVQSGTTTSDRGRARERGRNSLNLVRVAEHHLEVVHCMYVEEAGGFAPFGRHEFPRGYPSRVRARESAESFPAAGATPIGGGIA